MGRGSSGPVEDHVYSLASGPISASGLAVRPDPQRPDKHAFVEPREALDLASYEQKLRDTRPRWRREWP